MGQNKRNRPTVLRPLVFPARLYVPSARPSPQCAPDPDVDELSPRATQPVADPRQALGLRQLTEEHRGEPSPTVEPLGVALGTMLSHESSELYAVHDAQK